MNVMRTLNNHIPSFSGSGSQTPDQDTNKSVHIPVLLQEVLDNLKPQPGDVILDGTLGGGGHAAALLREINCNGVFVGIDADENAIKRARCYIEKEYIDKKNCTIDHISQIHFIKDNFRNIDIVLDSVNIKHIDVALFDLGFSSDQLIMSKRGISFKDNEPLLMTLKDDVDDDTLTAQEIVNTWDEESIADIIYGFGGEHFSRRIAQVIVRERMKNAITTTDRLVDIIRSAVPHHYRHGRIHPATRTFQALRIVVNDEFGALEHLLNSLPTYCIDGTRIGFITFHSLEDRIIKRKFKYWKEHGYGTTITKKPINPSVEEIKENRRARSAKLRVFQWKK